MQNPFERIKLNRVINILSILWVKMSCLFFLNLFEEEKCMFGGNFSFKTKVFIWIFCCKIISVEKFKFYTS